MALKLLQPGVNPIGQLDGLDSEVLTLKGGEVVTLTTVAVPGSDKAAYDAFDGYVNTSGSEKRVVVTKTLTDGYVNTLMLADEGIKGYGTILGTVLGGSVGQDTVGTAVGPSTASGSGKVTCWDKPGLYAVSLDACDTNATTGLQPTNLTLKAGDRLYATTAGLLTPNSAAAFNSNVVVGRFVSFETNGSLVTTPSKLVQNLATKSFGYAVFHFQVER